MQSEIYQKVAAHCSEYRPSKSCGCKNASSEENVSCVNCEHFNSSQHCDLDLIDRIVDQHNYK